MLVEYFIMHSHPYCAELRNDPFAYYSFLNVVLAELQV